MYFQHQHFGTKVAEDLRHLHADHTTADNAEFLRRGSQVPDSVGGDHAAAGEIFTCARNRRHKRGRAGGDHRGPKRHSIRFALYWRDFERMRVDEFSEAFTHVNLHAFIGFQRHLATRRLHPAPMFLDLRPIQHWRRRALHTHFGVVRAIADHIGRSPPRFRRDAAPPQTFATRERLVVDHHHLDTMVDQIARAILAARPPADHGNRNIPVAFGDGRDRGTRRGYAIRHCRYGCASRHPYLRVFDHLLQVHQIQCHIGAI